MFEQLLSSFIEHGPVWTLVAVLVGWAIWKDRRYFRLLNHRSDISNQVMRDVETALVRLTTLIDERIPRQ